MYIIIYFLWDLIHIFVILFAIIIWHWFLLNSHFYGLAADRQEYRFTEDFLIFFYKVIFEPKQIFFQIRIKNSRGCVTLSFSICLLVSE